MALTPPRDRFTLDPDLLRTFTYAQDSFHPFPSELRRVLDRVRLATHGLPKYIRVARACGDEQVCLPSRIPRDGLLQYHLQRSRNGSESCTAA